jgi:ribosomal protein L13E
MGSDLKVINIAKTQVKWGVRPGSEMKIRAYVLRRGEWRKGRGFSLKELEEAKLDLKEALRYGIPVDKRRKTKHERNVKVLREFIRWARREV